MPASGWVALVRNRYRIFQAKPPAYATSILAVMAGLAANQSYGPDRLCGKSR